MAKRQHIIFTQNGEVTWLSPAGYRRPQRVQIGAVDENIRSVEDQGNGNFLITNTDGWTILMQGNNFKTYTPGKLVYSNTDLAYPIRVYTSRGERPFTVVYGCDVKTKLTYFDAAKELGHSILHALSLAGKLDHI